MKDIIGVSLCIIGILLGLYVGVYIMFIGGILGIASAIDSGTISGYIIAINIIKIIFSSLAGFICFLIPSSIGCIIIDK